MKYYNFIGLVNHETNTIYPIVLTNTQTARPPLRVDNNVCMFDLDCVDYCIIKKMNCKIHDDYVPIDKTVESFLSNFKFPYNPETDIENQGYLTMNDLSRNLSVKKYRKIIHMINEIEEMYDWCINFSWDSVVVVLGKVE